MSTIKFRTTQNVAVEYEIASIGDRILAQIIDYAVFLGWIIIFSVLVSFVGADYKLVTGFLMFLPLLFYHLVCEIFMNGQSIGKKARDIKVIKLSGEAPTVVDYVMRWVFRLLDIGMGSGLIAILTIAINGKGQRLGDLAAGTSVIRTRAVRKQNFIRFNPDENHMITFTEVSHLTDKDVALIRKLLFKALRYQNWTLLEKLATRTKEVMGVETSLEDDVFLKTALKDYYHFTMEVEA